MLTERDERLLKWVGRWPFVSVDQIVRETARWSEKPMPKRVVQRRVAEWLRLGLVEREKIMAAFPPVVWLTREGLRLVGLKGQAAGPRVSQFRHDYVLTDVAHAIMVDRPTHTLVTEREMRAHETPTQHADAEERYSVRRLATTGRAQRFYPDLVTVTPSGRQIIHEFENTRKDSKRIRRIMDTYIRSEHIAAIRYYGEGALIPHLVNVADGANQAALERGLNTSVTVVEVHGAGSGEAVEFAPAGRTES